MITARNCYLLADIFIIAISFYVSYTQWKTFYTFTLASDDPCKHICILWADFRPTSTCSTVFYCWSSNMETCIPFLSTVAKHSRYQKHKFVQDPCWRYCCCYFLLLVKLGTKVNAFCIECFPLHIRSSLWFYFSVSLYINKLVHRQLIDNINKHVQTKFIHTSIQVPLYWSYDYNPRWGQYQERRWGHVVHAINTAVAGAV